MWYILPTTLLQTYHPTTTTTTITTTTTTTTTITTAAAAPTPAWLASVGGVAGLPDTNCWRVSLRIFLKLRPGGEPQVDSLGAAPPGPREGLEPQGSASEPVPSGAHRFT
ncbi:hypothetical protein E2C01_035398 [Portunus trituberculatus]|uniref:Uncharacterized protein n=1 Tax=Portunus trituberculatus TaxID=210409 RepID=A0A5B7F9N2_PORTR|nr:hypothetical protein [Portunus trituberculatus]